MVTWQEWVREVGDDAEIPETVLLFGRTVTMAEIAAARTEAEDDHA